MQYENKNVINSSLDCLQALSQNKYTNLDCDKKFTDVKLKDNNSGINFNQIGNKTVSFPVSSPKNKSGVKLNMQYSSSYEDDLGPRNK